MNRVAVVIHGVDGPSRPKAHLSESGRWPPDRSCGSWWFAHYKPPTNPQEGGSAFGSHRRGSKASRHDQVIPGPVCVLATNFLGPAIQYQNSILQAQCSTGPGEEVGPAELGIQKGPLRSWPHGCRQHQARKTTARTQIQGTGGDLDYGCGKCQGMTDVGFYRTRSEKPELTALGEEIGQR